MAKWWEFWLWGVEEEASPEPEVKLGWQGQEVHVNPTDAQAMDRNASRIQRLTAELARADLRSERRASLESELARRLRSQPKEG